MSAPIPPWEPLSTPVLQDQRGTYDRMRASCPAARSPRGVTLFRHADVVAAALDPDSFSSAVSTHRMVPNSLDPPEHDRYRAIVDRFFTPARMQALEPRVRAIAHDVVASQPRGVTIEAVREIGAQFAVAAQADWLGWQGTETQLLDWMASNHAATRAADRARSAAVAAAFDDIVLAQVHRRRAAGAEAPDDPTTELVQLVVDDAPLPDADIVSILRNWTAGDLGSMAAAAGVVIHFLATHADVQVALRNGALDPAAAIDEMLRIDDPFLANRRVTTRAVTVGDVTLEAGTRVYLNWTSANRDERVFGDPDVFAPDINANRNLVYGVGIHVCPGRPLATMELVVLTQALLQATTAIELATDQPAERETYPLGGWRRLPVLLQHA